MADIGIWTPLHARLLTVALPKYVLCKPPTFVHEFVRHRLNPEKGKNSTTEMIIHFLKENWLTTKTERKRNREKVKEKQMRNYFVRAFVPTPLHEMITTGFFEVTELNSVQFLQFSWKSSPTQKLPTTAVQRLFLVKTKAKRLNSAALAKIRRNEEKLCPWRYNARRNFFLQVCHFYNGYKNAE